MGEIGEGVKGGECGGGLGVAGADLGPSTCVIRGGGFLNSKKISTRRRRLVMPSK